MFIRNGSASDAEKLAEIERKCFPEAEAATLNSFRERLQSFPNRFWLMCMDNGEIVAFVNGILTDSEILCDEMYEHSEMHQPSGKWQMIFGVDTAPEYQHNGYATALLQHIIEQCRSEGRQGIVLTCKKQLLPFYSRVGFVSQGKSSSVHGGAEWYQMRKSFSV